MPDFVSVKVLTLRGLLSGAYRFELPWFQRAYAWDTEEAGRLLTHVIEASRSGAPPKPYFLGTLVVAREQEETATALIDGQQRIMTLTILFAVLRDMEATGERKSEIQALVGSGIRFHMVPQESCAKLCRQYVQAEGGTNLEYDADDEELSEAELHILDNRDHLRQQLAERLSDVRLRWELFLYLADHCHVVVHAFRDSEEAWRWLQREEETQHRFNAADKAKASLTLAMPAGDRAAAGQIWDECEALLGGEDIFELLRHLRLLHQRKISAKPVEPELSREFGLNRGGRAFMESQLWPIAKRLAAIRGGGVGTGETTIRIAASVERATWIDTQVWVPAALLWLEVRGEGPDAADFFERLERLVWLMRLSGMDGPKKEQRIIRLLAEIEAGTPVEAMRHLAVDALKSSALRALRAEAFDRKHFARPVLRLASLALGQSADVFDQVGDTNEHIFPQGKGGRAPWRGDFPLRSDGCAHRLGNLTLLTREDNRRLANRAWSEKRQVYARSDFVLSREIAELPRWTPADVTDRTERLINVLLRYWGLHV